MSIEVVDGASTPDEIPGCGRPVGAAAVLALALAAADAPFGGARNGKTVRNGESLSTQSLVTVTAESTSEVLTHPSWWRPAAAAAIAAALTLLAVMLPMRSQMRRQLAEQEERFDARLAEQRQELEQVRTELAEAREVAGLLHSPSVQLVSMQAGEPQPQAWGRIVWDKTRGVWQLYTFDMAPAGPDKTYELWFITADERKVPAGTFDVGADGVGSLRVALPDDLGDVALAAITDEPAGGVPQPTGSIQLVGELVGRSS